ncbi:MAG TPA: DEAD/DEAH box helicase, partial [Thermoanaerobaculia bacterium]|nr:DEAD/DEAH box helicase [Thermoanaerobaculia bacterium]
IRNYNREDCVSTLELQKWLVQLRAEAGVTTWQEGAPAPPSPDAIEIAKENDELAKKLSNGLLANLLYYHRREDRPAWWWYFERLKMSPDELKDDHESIGGLTLADDIAPRQEKRSTIYTFRFPAQEHKLSPDQDIVDPATEQKVNVIRIDDANGLIEIKRGSTRTGPFPQSLIPGGPLQTKPQREAIRRFARSLCHPERSEGPGRPAGTTPEVEPRYQAALDILLRRPMQYAPSPVTSPSGEVGPAERDRVRGLVQAAYLFVQGPPGAGKTRWGGNEIVRLLKEGKRIGVTSNSHKAIHNLLEEVERVAKKENVTFIGLKKCTSDRPETEYTGTFIHNSADVDDFLDPNVQLLAGTSWLFADARFDQLLDYLFIDEAGQIALANAIALATSAKEVRLLGDPLQLAQVSQAVHPDHSGDSVLEHLLGEHATIPPDRGLFLEHTWRMHPDVCRFISEVVYEGRLESAPECSNRRVTAVPSPTGRGWREAPGEGLHGTGLGFIPVTHQGNSQSSSEEAARIAAEIAKLLDGGEVTDEKGATRKLEQKDIMVVAPYNAQVRCVTEVLRQRGIVDVPVGTVDKFQGRQAEVVFFTMATSSGDDLPRDIDFLFSKNRLNVAISRARCLAIVVASPRLLDVACNTPEQMMLVNALCRFVEMASVC